MKQLLKKILFSFTGKKKYQRFFEKLHRFALYGLNVGRGTDIKDSGEKFIITLVQQNYLSHNFRLDDLTIFDVDANLGHYALLWSEKCLGRIYAFEPAKQTYQLMKNHLGYNNTIVPCNLGFSNKQTKARLYSDPERIGLTSLYQRELSHLGLTLSQQEEIELDTIDNFCHVNNILRIHFLKLDVEGHELNVLQGAQRLLAEQKIDHIQFEFGGCNIDARTYFRDFYHLLSPQFDLYRILKDGLHPIPQYRETHEAFLTTNYLAIRKNLWKR